MAIVMDPSKVLLGDTPVPDPKPGYLSTEFWTHTLLSAVWVLGAGFTLFVHTGLPSWVSGVVPIVAVAAALISQLAYLVHRHGLKKASLATYITWMKTHEPDFVAVWNAISDLRAGRVPPGNVPDVPLPEAKKLDDHVGMMPGADRHSEFDMNAVSHN